MAQTFEIEKNGITFSFPMTTTIEEIVDDLNKTDELLEAIEQEEDIDDIIDIVLEEMNAWRKEYDGAFSSATRFWKEYNKKLAQVLGEVM